MMLKIEKLEMTYMKKTIISLLLLPISIFANEIDLEAKIAKLQNAPKSERFKIMNEIKYELSQMNEKERTKAIQKLRYSIHKKENPHKNRKQNDKGLKHKILHQEKMHAHKKNLQNKNQVKNHQKYENPQHQSPKTHQISPNHDR